MGKPVKLMWHRADEPRQGRLHPMVTSRVRATHLAGQVLSFEQRHTSVATDFSHGLGEMLTSQAAELPAGVGAMSLSQSIFALTQELPYNFGVVDPAAQRDRRAVQHRQHAQHLLPGHRGRRASSSSTCSPRRCSKDPLEFRLEFLKNERVRAVLRKVAEEGDWGRAMPPGTAQGIAVHKEYKGATACLVEIDCRPATVDRKVREASRGPRVTKAVIAVDAGLVINPRGLEAQMTGGFYDGLALTLTSSCHLRDGHFLEASWDNYFYTRQWNIPPELEVHRHALRRRPARRGRRGRRGRLRRRRRLRLRPGDRDGADGVPDQPRHRLVRPQAVRAPRPAVAHQRPAATPTEERGTR